MTRRPLMVGQLQNGIVDLRRDIVMGAPAGKGGTPIEPHARASNWMDASRPSRELVQTIAITLDLAQDHYRLTGSFPSVDQVLARIARP